MLVSCAVLFAVEAPAPVLAPTHGDRKQYRLNPARPNRRNSSSGAESGAAPRSSKKMQVTRLTVADGLGFCDFPPLGSQVQRPSQFISGVRKAPRTPLQSHARR